MNDTFAIVYAGHGNQLLGDLIAHRCVSALPFAGRYRTIDVLLSNLSRSGIRDVGVIMDRNFQSLVEHIGSGDPWDLHSKRGGVALLTPFDQGMSTNLYRSIGDALFAKRYYIERQRARKCLLLASDVVYRDDYRRLIARHEEAGADITLLSSRDARLARGDATHLASLSVEEDGRVSGIAFGAAGEGGRFSLGACVIDKELLLRLVEDACAEGRYDFLGDIIEPAVATHRVFAFGHEGYAARLSSVKSYFDMARDMRDSGVRDEMFYEHGPVYTRVADTPPVRYAPGCEVEDSLFGNGCDVRGRVAGSVVFRDVEIAEGADVQDSIVMAASRIGEGARLRNAIVDKEVVVEPGARVIGTPDVPAVIRKGSIVQA